MTFTLPTRHRSNRDAEIHRLYHKAGYLRMRIARIFDCRMREVNEALARVSVLEGAE